MDLRNDLRYGLRQLTKSPGFAAVALIALALGIGANTALFSIIDGLFLRPLPYPQAERIVHLTTNLGESDLRNAPLSYPRYELLRSEQRVFSALAVGTFNAFTVTEGAEPEQVGGFMASADYLSALGLQPALGRAFTADEDRKGGPAVALIADAYWRQHYHSDPGVLGRALTLDGRPYTIVGVLPAALSRFPLDRISVWTPRPAETPGLVPAQLDNGALAFEVVGRLAPGVTLAQAREQIRVLGTVYERTHPRNVDANATVNVNPLLQDLVGNQRPTYLLLAGAVGCVLLIACANVANLLLARFTARRKEIALRFALGATRRDVVRQLVMESMLVALLGAVGGVFVAEAGLAAFLRLGADFIPRAAEITLNAEALGFTLFIALLTGLGMGIIPALQSARGDASDALKDAARGSSPSAAQRRLRGALLVGEIALSLVLLIAASLLLSSFARLQHVSLGFQPERVFAGVLNVPPERYPGKAALAGFYQRVVDRVAALPGVKAVALSDAPPLSGADPKAPIAVVGRPLPALRDRPLALRHLVTPGSFAVLGISLKRGRDFGATDNPDSPQTVIINETLARRFFPDTDPVGQKLVTGMGQVTAEIVGVVGDTHSLNLTAPPSAEYFLPALQRPEPFAFLLVRTETDPAGIASAVRGALREVDPGLALTQPQTMPAMIARSVADRRLALVLLGAFAGLALVLASIGVYSVMAYIVTQRTTEIGIRLALGATPGRIQRMVLRQGMKLVLWGVAAGLAVAFAFTRVMSSLLFEVRADDPLIYGSLTALLCAIAALACWIPARRATAVDPLTALHTS